MKKIVLTLAVLLGLGIFVNAQNLQRGVYNDGRVLVYIEQRNNIYRNNPNQRADELQLENISGQEITVHYCYRAVGLDANGNIFTEKMEYETLTLKPEEKKSESGYMNARGYYVDSFAIMNVSVRQIIPQNRPQQNVTPPQNSSGSVPRELLGTWTYGDSFLIITANQLQIVLDENTIATTINGVSILNNSRAGFPYSFNISHTIRSSSGSFSSLEVGRQGNFELYLNQSRNRLSFGDTGYIFDKL